MVGAAVDECECSCTCPAALKGEYNRKKPQIQKPVDGRYQDDQPRRKLQLIPWGWSRPERGILFNFWALDEFFDCVVLRL